MPKNSRKKKKGKRVKQALSSLIVASKAQPVMKNFKYSKSTFKPKVNQSGTRCLVNGSDFVCDLTLTTANDVPGAVLMNMALNPVVIPVSRLNALCPTFEYWKIKRMTMRFQGSMATSFHGSAVGFYDYDYNDDLGSAIDPSLRNLAHAHRSCKTFKWYDAANWNYDAATIVPRLYTDINSYDPSLSFAGRFYVINDVSSGVLANTVVGSLYLDYEIEFSEPQLSPSYFGRADKYTCTDARSTCPFGTFAMHICAWNNLPLQTAPVIAENTFVVYPGSYLVVFKGHTTTGDITNCAVTPNAAATVIETQATIASNATACVCYSQFYCDSICTVTVTYTTTASTNGNNTLEITTLPYLAVSLARSLKGKLQKLNEDFKELKSVETKEETKVDIKLSTMTASEPDSPVIVAKKLKK